MAPFCVPGAGFLCTMIVPGEGFLLPSSRVPIVKYLITIKTLAIKKFRRNRQKFEIFFVKFQAPLSQKIVSIYLYISYKAFMRSIV